MPEKSSGSYLPNSINTLIGPSTRIEGDVACNGVLRVQGDIEGNVACDATPGSALVVDSAGSVTGNVRAAHVAVRGRLVGPLESLQSIEVHQGGSISGDISFRELAIHAGGVVNGSLKPSREPATADAAAGAAAMPPGRAPKDGPQPGRAAALGSARKAAVAIVVAGVAAAAWFGRDGLLPSHPAAGDAALRTDTALREVKAPPPDHAEIKPHEERKAAPEPPAAAAATTSAPPPAPERTEADDGKILAVRGANPSRPANVFLLVTNEPTVLYRKKRGDPGEGARLAVGEGERVSVSISQDELIRIAKGTDITIFYQGQKLPRQYIASGSWISLVAR